MSEVYVIGASCTAFGKRADTSFQALAREVVQQARGEVGPRQVPGTVLGLVKNGGAVIGFDEAACPGPHHGEGAMSAEGSPVSAQGRSQALIPERAARRIIQ